MQSLKKVGKIFFQGGFTQFRIDFPILCEPTSASKRLLNNPCVRTSTAPILASTIALMPSNTKSLPSSPFSFNSEKSTTASDTHTTCTATSNQRQPNRIFSFLYLGSMEDAFSEKTLRVSQLRFHRIWPSVNYVTVSVAPLKDLKISHIINVTQQCPKPDFIDDENFLRISVNDSHCAKLLPHFESAIMFIGEIAFFS
jgi:hypothetical protein